MQPRGQRNYWQPQADNGDQEGQPSLEAMDTFDESGPALPDNISWDAPEFIHHEKSAAWFGVFALVILAALSFVLLVMHDYILAIVVTVMAIALFVFARRPLHMVRYTLSSKGLHIGQQFHPLTSYRAFGVVQDGEHFAVILLPVKRFALAKFVYFPQEQGERIVDFLGSYLPMDPIKMDIVESIFRKIRL
ncbi:MAG TPA: hypothetical protein VFZ48_04600 [Candidatus Saccharimonadales bacterium]